MATKLGLPPYCETVEVSTSVAGNASVTTENAIIGEVFAIAYDRGSVNSETTAVITSENPTLTIDSYNVNTAATAIRGIGCQVADSSDSFVPIPVRSKLAITVSGGAQSKAFTVYVYYR